MLLDHKWVKICCLRFRLVFIFCRRTENQDQRRSCKRQDAWWLTQAKDAFIPSFASSIHASDKSLLPLQERNMSKLENLWNLILLFVESPITALNEYNNLLIIVQPFILLLFANRSTVTPSNAREWLQQGFYQINPKAYKVFAEKFSDRELQIFLLTEKPSIFR